MSILLSPHFEFILLAYGAAFAILGGFLFYTELRHLLLNRRYHQLKQKAASLPTPLTDNILTEEHNSRA